MYASDYPAVIILIYFWIGFVCAISFMEAGLKFRAPGITLPLGLGIGRLVFRAMNKVEWVLALGILTNLVFYGSQQPFGFSVFAPGIIVLTILLFQTFRALPALNQRAARIITGNNPGKSRWHVYYVSMELIKVAVLFILGIQFFQKT